jgi:D-sedoheptulose 7-phosphate isomerase
MAAINKRAIEYPLHSSEDYFRRLARILPQLPFGTIDAMASVLLQAYDEGRTVFLFGNGGSAASASHAVCDLNKGAVSAENFHRLKVISLTDNVPLITAWANDAGYEYIFSEQLRNYLRPRDVAMAISCSGDSPNVLLALKTARALGGTTLGITGYQGGRMMSSCDICAIVPSDDVRMIEDMHHAMLHALSVTVAEHLKGRTPKFVAAAGSNGNGR